MEVTCEDVVETADGPDIIILFGVGGQTFYSYFASAFMGFGFCVAFVAVP